VAQGSAPLVTGRNQKAHCFALATDQTFQGIFVSQNGESMSVNLMSAIFEVYDIIILSNATGKSRNNTL